LRRKHCARCGALAAITSGRRVLMRLSRSLRCFFKPAFGWLEISSAWLNYWLPNRCQCGEVYAHKPFASDINAFLSSLMSKLVCLCSFFLAPYSASLFFCGGDSFFKYPLPLPLNVLQRLSLRQTSKYIFANIHTHKKKDRIQHAHIFQPVH
jgi:hypothetical protein